VAVVGPSEAGREIAVPSWVSTPWEIEGVCHAASAADAVGRALAAAT